MFRAYIGFRVRVDHTLRPQVYTPELAKPSSPNSNLKAQNCPRAFHSMVFGLESLEI